MGFIATEIKELEEDIEEYQNGRLLVNGSPSPAEMRSELYNFLRGYIACSERHKVFPKADIEGATAELKAWKDNWPNPAINLT